MAITLTFDQTGAGIPAGVLDRGRTDIKNTGPVGSPRAHPVTITVGSIPTGALVEVVMLDEPPGANPLLTELAPETWSLQFDVGCWGPFRVRVTATASGNVVSSVTRRISIRSPGYHIDYPGLAERYDPNATSVPTVPSVEMTEMNEGSTNRPLVDFHRQMVEAIETGGSGGSGVIPDGSITEEKLAPELSDNLLRADGTIPFTGDQDAAGHIIHNVGAPLVAGDAVPLSTVLAAVNRAGTRSPCRLVATTPITASNTQVIDTKPTVNADRVLLTAQPSAADNGLYLANDTGAWVRTTDTDSSEELLPGMVIFITDGATYADSGWILSTDAPIALGTSPLTFTRFTGAAQVVAGAGMTKTGNVLDVVAHADGSIVVSADAVQVGTLATDAQHAARGGGTLHAAVIAGGASGFMTGADKTKLDGVAASAAALTSSAPAAVGTTAAVGVGTTAARSDHVHAHGAQVDGTLHAAASTTVAGFLSPGDKTKLDGVAAGAAALASTTPAAVAFTSTVGVGTTAARSDHVHAHGAQVDGTLHAAASTTVAGFLSPGDKTKLDGVAAGAAALTATAPTQITVTAAAVGVETAAAKGDHVHSVSTGAPSPLTVAGSQSTGAASSLARSDHVHAMPDVATTTAPGFLSAADKTRLDGMATGAAALTSTAPVAVDNAAAALGVGTTAARHDHRHTVTVGTPVALTVAGANAQGSATSLVRSDHTHAMPALVTTGADGFMSATDKSKLDGVEAGAQVTSFARVQAALAAASSPVSLNSQKITNVLDPTSNQEVATKAYVDAIAQGLDVKTSCRLVATSNVATLSGSQTIDGIATSTADRVLLAGQTTASANGIYVTAAGAWARAPDADASAEVTSGLYTYITEGSANADSGWALTTNDPIVLGTTALVFTQVSGAGQITAGAGMTKTGNVLDVVAHADGSIVVAADSIQLGVIASDAQHGARAGGSTHAAVVAGGAAGFITGTDKTKLDGVATGAAAVSSAIGSTVSAGAAVAGTNPTAARDDHQHQALTGTPSTLAIGGTNTIGAGNQLARASHVHQLPALATTSSDGFLAQGDKLKIDNAASVAYVDALPIKQACRVVHTGTASPSGLLTIDGITVAANDRVLCTGQLVWQSNGIYLAASGAWTRAPDADTSAKIPVGMIVPIGPDGTTYALTHWVLMATAPISLGSSNLLFQQLSTKYATVASPNVTAAAAAIGTGITVARQDHTHQVATAAPAALTVGAASSAGASTSLVRADHVHAMPGLASTSVDGFMSAADKLQIAGLPVRTRAYFDVRLATNNILPAYTASTISANRPRLIATANGALSIDNVPVVVGDLVLVLFEAVANCGVYQVVATGSAGAPYQLDLAYSGAYTALATGSQMIVRTGGAGYAYCNREFRPGSTTSGLFVEIPGVMQQWPQDTTPPTTLYPGWMYNLESLVGTTPSLTLVSPPGSEQVLRGVMFGVSVGAQGESFNTVTLGTTFSSHISPPNMAGADGTTPPNPITFILPAGASATWVCGRGYTGYDPDSPYWRGTYGGANLPITYINPANPIAVPTAAPGPNTVLTVNNLGNTLQWLPPTIDPAINGLRLAPTVDDSIPADGTFSTVYLAPVKSNRIALWDSSQGWVPCFASSVSYALAGRTAGLPFDVFAYQITPGTAAIEVLNWSSVSPPTRTTAIAKSSGVWVKSGDTTRRYLGTVRPRSATTYQIRRAAPWNVASAGVDIWNVDNRRQTPVALLAPSGTNWTYNTAAYRQANATAAAQIDTIAGLAEDAIAITLAAESTATSTGAADYSSVAISAPTTSSPTASGLRANVTVNATTGGVQLIATAAEITPLGVGAYKWLEKGSGAGGTQTWHGNSVAELQTGMNALVWC